MIGETLATVVNTMEHGWQVGMVFQGEGRERER